jgi:hypothetical protein
LAEAFFEHRKFIGSFVHLKGRPLIDVAALMARLFSLQERKRKSQPPFDRVHYFRTSLALNT